MDDDQEWKAALKAARKNKKRVEDQVAREKQPRSNVTRTEHDPDPEPEPEPEPVGRRHGRQRSNMTRTEPDPEPEPEPEPVGRRHGRQRRIVDWDAKPVPVRSPRSTRNKIAEQLKAGTEPKHEPRGARVEQGGRHRGAGDPQVRVYIDAPGVSCVGQIEMMARMMEERHQSSMSVLQETLQTLAHSVGEDLRSATHTSA